VASPASGHVGTCPLAFERIFSAKLYVETSCLVWFGTMPNSDKSALFVQPYLLLNDAITRYNRACAKIDFTARRHALAWSLLSAGVHPSVRHVRVLYCIQTAEDIIKHLSRPGSPTILVFDSQTLIPNSRRTPSSGCKIHRALCDFGLKSPFISDGRR